MSGDAALGPGPRMKFTAARLLGMLALIVDRAEACVAEGDAPEDAIDRALHEHYQAAIEAVVCRGRRDHGHVMVEIEATARFVWRTMTVGEEPDPLANEWLRETLERFGLLGVVREEMRRAMGTQPEAVGALRHARCFSTTRARPRMCEAIEGFHAYATIVHEATGTRPAVHELAAALLVLARTNG